MAKAITKELDKLVQGLSKNQRCHVCGVRNATEVHHIVTRGNDLLRYDPANLLPICGDCHKAIHDRGLDVSAYLRKDRWNYLQRTKNQSYKNMLTFELGMSEDEYFRWCKKTLKDLQR